MVFKSAFVACHNGKFRGFITTLMCYDGCSCGDCVLPLFEVHCVVFTV